MHERLAAFVRSRASIDEASLEELDRLSRERTFAAGETISRAGRPVSCLHFVVGGAVRSFDLIDGEDVTDYFFFEGSFAADFAALYTGAPSALFLEAIEPTRTVELPRAALLALADGGHPWFARFLRTTAERAFVEIEERMRLLHNASLETRYHWMLEHFPDVFARVPQYHVASYLGVKPESLSRLKRRLGTSARRGPGSSDR